MTKISGIGFWKTNFANRGRPYSGNYLSVRRELAPSAKELPYAVWAYPEGNSSRRLTNTDSRASAILFAQSYASKNGYTTILYPNGRVDWIRRK